MMRLDNNIYEEYYKRLKNCISSNESYLILKEFLVEHQIKVPFDTVTKINSYTESNYPLYFNNTFNIQNYIESGYMGTCFNATWAIYNLFKSVGIKAKLIHLIPGHVTTVVYIKEEAFLFDASLMSPIFDLYPLYEDWSTQNENENVSWHFKDNKYILSLNNNSHFKTWDCKFINEDFFLELWKKSYNPNNTFIKNLFITRYIDIETAVSIQNNTFKLFKNDKIVKEKVLNIADLKEYLKKYFNVNPNNYLLALNNLKKIGVDYE